MIDKKLIKKNLNLRSTQKDYSFGIIFLILSSFFVFFVIRPVLRIAFTLQKEKTDLGGIEKALNNNFNSALALRSKLEDIRTDLPVIEKSIPNRSQVDKISNEIFQIAQNHTLNLQELSFEGVKLLKDVPVASNEAFLFKTKFVSSDATFLQFLNSLYQSPRLITLDSLKILPQNKSKPEMKNIEIIMKIANWW